MMHTSSSFPDSIASSQRSSSDEVPLSFPFPPFFFFDRILADAGFITLGGVAGFSATFGVEFFSL